ncbi:hypothetical protein AJ79_00336 [Helicocarpus griseus UAMH5409]|uniref:Uncharacterized protein n=1 Tax=Helicocarpus griseus UAMH5409 TaxID=1447875 RepID=A0A2B7YD76_9EURO|nr:hypothetical protein AJ79_00336 [Helicocarpus griseus UAMH5409]
MGSCFSKGQKNSDPPNTAFDQPRPPRPQSQRTRSQGGPAPGTGGGKQTRPPSQMPRGQSRNQSRNQSRGQSRSHSRQHSRTQSRSQSQSGSKAPSGRGAKRHSTVLGTIPDIQPPEDSTIRDRITTLRLFIDQHSINFYRTQYDDSGASISRYIARTIISSIIEEQKNDRGVAENLADALQKYAVDPSNQKRNNHLFALCQTARKIADLIERHPANWTFSWYGGGDVQFPSVMRDQEEYMEATY